MPPTDADIVTVTYQVIGQVFFASADRFSNAFDYKEVIDKVRSDVIRQGIQMIAGSPLLKGLPIHLLMAGKPQVQGPKQTEEARNVLEGRSIRRVGASAVWRLRPTVACRGH